jgi:hypothetical protein
MVADMYKKFGFKKIKQIDENTVWSLDIKNYEAKQKCITVNNKKLNL